MPKLLRLWVLEDPAWRVVEVVPNVQGRRFSGLIEEPPPLLMRLHHITPEIDDHVENGLQSWEPEDVADAVLETLQTWYLTHGVYHPDVYEQIDQDRLRAYPAVAFRD